MADHNDLVVIVSKSKVEYSRAIRSLRRQRELLEKACFRMLAYAEKNEDDPKAYKYQQIHGCILDQCICLDKQHDLITRIRDLESYGEERTEEVGEVVIVREDDGHTHLVGEPPKWARVVAEAVAGDPESDTRNLH